MKFSDRGLKIQLGHARINRAREVQGVGVPSYLLDPEALPRNLWPLTYPSLLLLLASMISLIMRNPHSLLTYPLKLGNSQDMTPATALAMLIHELTSSHIGIIPFTISPLGGLGPSPTAFLFRATPTPSVPILSPTAKAARQLQGQHPSSRISWFLMAHPISQLPLWLHLLCPCT